MNNTPPNHPKTEERGIALLTVLAILTLLVIFATAFIQTVRLEIQTTRNYTNSVLVADVASIGNEITRQDLNGLVNGRDGLRQTGDEIRPYISLTDSWALGRGGVLDHSFPRSVYDLRTWNFNPKFFAQAPAGSYVGAIHNGAVWQAVTSGNLDGAAIGRLGLDEDPQGNFLGGSRSGMVQFDDDLDGQEDEGGDSYLRDDDEDGLIDEDGIERRIDVVGPGVNNPHLSALHMGIDTDGDYNRVEPSTARLNVSIAGNLNGGGVHVYHQGIHPSELDLETFMNVMLGEPGNTLARRIVQFRQGNGPGIPLSDDNKNADPNILGLFTTSTPSNVPGDNLDNDGDGLTDEEDEVLAGIENLPPTALKTTPVLPSDLLDNRADRALLLTNGVDDGGIADVKDDIFEIDDIDFASNPGLDDLAETTPRKPFGDDTPPRNRLNLQAIPDMDTEINYRTPDGAQHTLSAFELIEPFVTVESTVDRHSQIAPGDRLGNRRTLNPNLTLSQNPERTRQIPQYLLPLAGLDNDGDWGVGVIQQQIPPIFVSDDFNNNQTPDGDWDGASEETFGNPPFYLGTANRIDEDFDGKPDDNGDHNGDTLTDYDPEGHINEDPLSYRGLSLNEFKFYKGDSDADPIPPNFTEPAEFLDFLGLDGVDNNSNRTRWMSDGIDNDGDGLTDESFVDEVGSGIDSADARDEGVDEPGEWYLPSWDEDPDGIDNDSDGLTDNSGEVNNSPVERYRFKLSYKMDEDPIDLSLPASLADSLDYSNDPKFTNGVSQFEIRDSTAHTLTRAIGNEAVRITEVLARPLIRLQAENADDLHLFGSWERDDYNGSDGEGRHFVNPDGNGTADWTWNDIPPGKYYVLAYSWATSASADNGGIPVTAEYNLGEDSAISVIPSGTNPNLVYTPMVEPASSFFPSPLFARAFLGSSTLPPRLFYSEGLIEFATGDDLELTIQCNANNDVSFDYVELFAPDAQYVEICNFGERPVDLFGWEFRTVATNSSNEPVQKTTRIGGAVGDHILKPGQFAVMYADDFDPTDSNERPSGINALNPRNYPGANGLGALRLTADELIAPGTDPLDLCGSLQDILFSYDSASVVELWAPYNNDDIDETTHELVDAFDYHVSADFGSPVDVLKRQDTLAFSPEHRGDPTRSVLRHDLSQLNTGVSFEVVQSHVHGPMRFLVEDSVVTIDDPGAELEVDANVKDGKYYKPAAFRGRTYEGDPSVSGAPAPATSAVYAVEEERTEYGETLFEISDNVRQTLDSEYGATIDGTSPTFTFHWPGIVNHFRDPSDGSLPFLYIRAGGISGATYCVGGADLDPKDGDERDRFVFNGDLLYILDPNTPGDFEDIYDPDTDSIRITLRIPKEYEEGTGLFSYIEITPGYTDRYIAGDPGREHYYYVDSGLTTPESRFLFMERRRVRNAVGSPPLFYQRSLRFREGPLANCSPYLASANGRNIEKYSMGRGLFSGPTAEEMRQIASRMEFLPAPIADGLVNINCADQKVLTALPFFPPESGNFASVSLRAQLAALMSQVLVMGRSQRGFDGEIGQIGTDDDGDGGIDLADVGLPGSGAGYRYLYQPHWDVAVPGIQGYGRANFDDDGDGVPDNPEEYRAPGSDDGPYASVGDIARAMLHPSVVQALQADLGGTISNLRASGWTGQNQWDESDIHIMMGRIMNLITVESNEFTAFSSGRLFDTLNISVDNSADNDNLIAEQSIEEDLGRQ